MRVDAAVFEDAQAAVVLDLADDEADLVLMGADDDARTAAVRADAGVEVFQIVGEHLVGQGAEPFGDAAVHARLIARHAGQRRHFGDEPGDVFDIQSVSLLCCWA